MRIKTIKSEDIANKFKDNRKNWPFKDMKVGDAIELPNGFNGRDLTEISVAARVYASKAKIKIKTKTDRTVGDGVIYILRVE